MQTLKYYIQYIFKFNTANIISDTLPGESEKCNGIWIYTADKTKTKQVIEDLFTDKVLVEEEDNNTITNTITSGEAEEQITIELLNGTGDSEVLEKVKGKLKEKGYVISKSGTTSSTSKTTIINRTSQSNSTSKDIKSILGVGSITSGSNNTKVDYTIIIGKDYE